MLPASATSRHRRPPAPRPPSAAPGRRLVACFDLALLQVHRWLDYFESRPARAGLPLDLQRQDEVNDALILFAKAISRERGLAAIPFVASRSMRLTHEQARLLLLIAMDRLLGLHARHVERGMPDLPPDREAAHPRQLRPRGPLPPRRVVRPPALPAVRMPAAHSFRPPDPPAPSRFERAESRSLGLAQHFRRE